MNQRLVSPDCRLPISQTPCSHSGPGKSSGFTERAWSLPPGANSGSAGEDPAPGRFADSSLPKSASDIEATVPAEIASIVLVAAAAPDPKAPAAAPPYTRDPPISPMMAPLTAVSSPTRLPSAAVIPIPTLAPTAADRASAAKTPMQPTPVAQAPMMSAMTRAPARSDPILAQSQSSQNHRPVVSTYLSGLLVTYP